ncbi:MAG: PQQ-binding-like beta-propeller repeat protein [Pirellulaceae bacterium]
MHIISPPSVRRHVLTGLVAFGCMSLAWASDSFAQENWPEFRGPHSNGWADESSHPAVEFGEGNHVTWKTEIHGRGWSSPVVWGNQIWMGTADEDGKHFYGICVNKETGEIEHDLVLFEEAEPKFCHDMNSYASPTPVIEEGFVYLHFGSYGTPSSFDGRRERGPGAAGIFRAIIFAVQGRRRSHGAIADHALRRLRLPICDRLEQANGRNGSPVTIGDIDYGTDNGDVMKAYNTPSIIEVDGYRPLLISSTSKACPALDPATGEEVWRLRYSGFSSTGRPFMAGLLYINSGFSTAELLFRDPPGWRGGYYRQSRRLEHE